MTAKYLAAVAAALLLFALLQVTTKGPNPTAESLAIEVKPAALSLAAIMQMAGTPQFQQYAETLALANNTNAQTLRQLATLMKDLDSEMKTLEEALAQNNATEAQNAYAKAQSDLNQIKGLLTELGIWDQAKDYYTAAYLRLEAYGRALQRKASSNVTLQAPQRVRAGGTMTINITVSPPNGTLLIYLDGNLTGEAAIAKRKAIRLPVNIYKPQIELAVVYVPNSPQYGPSSANATIGVEYLNTTIEAQCPQATWGEAVKINGTITSDAKYVTVKIDNMAENATAVGGTFSAVVNTTELTPGPHVAKIYAPPSANATCLLNITAEPPPLRIPNVLIAGVPLALTPYYRYTPSLLESTGPKRLALYIPPHFPYSGATVEAEVILINPLQIAAVAGLAAFLAAVLRRRAQTAVWRETPSDFA
ncbi:MAG: hypothetical protein QXK63_04410, partial [Thermoproteus sp.]